MLNAPTHPWGHIKSHGLTRKISSIWSCHLVNVGRGCSCGGLCVTDGERRPIIYKTSAFVHALYATDLSFFAFTSFFTVLTEFVLILNVVGEKNIDNWLQADLPYFTVDVDDMARIAHISGGRVISDGVQSDRTSLRRDCQVPCSTSYGLSLHFAV